MKNNVSKAVGAVSGMTLLSRIFGFVRDMFIAMAFGSSTAADAFFVAFRIPNMQRRVLGEGAVASAFIPVFSETLENKGQQAAQELTANIFNILLILLSVTSLALFIFSPAVVSLFAPGFLDDQEKFKLTVDLTRWMAPYLFFIGLAAFSMGLLNSLKVFALPAATPILQNISMIAAILILAPQMDEPIMGLAIGVIVGGALQTLIQLPTIVRKGYGWKKRLHFKQPEVVKIAKLMVPAILGLAVYELNLMVDTLLASTLPEGSISYLYYGNRLVQLPLGVFAVALAVVLLPTLSGHAAKGELKELVQTVSFSIRLILFITIPATIGLIILREPIVNTLWERGEFLQVSTQGTAVALLYYSIGLCAYSGVKIIAPAFYSLQDTKTPAKIGIYSMVLNIVLNLILIGPLQHGGLALATSLSALFNAVLLTYFLRKRLGLLGGRKILRATIKMGISAATMGIAIYFCKEAWFDLNDPIVIRITVLLTCISVGILVYALISHLLKNEEWRYLLDMRRNKAKIISTNVT
jgi:putative peptidoglycan lipid II flippase